MLIDPVVVVTVVVWLTVMIGVPVKVRFQEDRRTFERHFRELRTSRLRKPWDSWYSTHSGRVYPTIKPIT